MLRKLAENGVNSLLVEGGGTLAAGALAAGVVDRVYFFLAPLILGGAEARSPVEGDGVSRLAVAWRMQSMRVRRIGEDLLITGEVVGSTNVMFTGLIEEVGTIAANCSAAAACAWRCAPSGCCEDLKQGDSVAVSGPCLTVERIEGDRFYASLLPETAEATTLAAWQVGRKVNLERALRLGDRLGGHLVSGHVDGVAEVGSVVGSRRTRG